MAKVYEDERVKGGNNDRVGICRPFCMLSETGRCCCDVGKLWNLRAPAGYVSSGKVLRKLPLR